MRYVRGASGDGCPYRNRLNPSPVGIRTARNGRKPDVERQPARTGGSGEFRTFAVIPSGDKVALKRPFDWLEYQERAARSVLSREALQSVVGRPEVICLSSPVSAAAIDCRRPQPGAVRRLARG